MEGHLAAEAAIRIGIDKARETGIAAVAVRGGYHIGVAGRYVRIAAENGCVAFAMCNTKPVMAAPGGLDKLAGTNPLAIGIPAADGSPIVLDMATTAGTTSHTFVRLTNSSRKRAGAPSGSGIHEPCRAPAASTPQAREARSL